MQMIFLALGIFLGCALKKFKLAGSTAIAVILVTYFTSAKGSGAFGKFTVTHDITKYTKAKIFSNDW